MIPDRLKKGDTISVIAVSNTAKPDDIQYLEKSKKLFEDLGINVIFGKNICSNTLGYGATVQEKVEDFLSKNKGWEPVGGITATKANLGNGMEYTLAQSFFCKET